MASNLSRSCASARQSRVGSWVAPDQSFAPEFTQILFENFANFHPNFAKISLRDSLRRPKTQPEKFAQKIANSGKRKKVLE